MKFMMSFLEIDAAVKPVAAAPPLSASTAAARQI